MPRKKVDSKREEAHLFKGVDLFSIGTSFAEVVCFQKECKGDDLAAVNGRVDRGQVQVLKTLQDEAKGSQDSEYEAKGSQDSEYSPASESELFLEATGGFLPSETMLGLCSATQLFYEKSTRGSNNSG
ncbi:hypothetical protein AKJ16_DCAP03719 [Drosera capensis]